MNTLKKNVHDFWNDASCGETLFLNGNEISHYNMQSKKRYELEPYILDFIYKEPLQNQNILEIGVGLGADHQELAMTKGILFGIDLTLRAIKHTQTRFTLQKIPYKLAQSDGESTPFKSGSFEHVYSWGVIHHSPNTQAVVDEIYRILKPMGSFKVMIYHKYSFVGYMLWVRYALMTLRVWTSLSTIYHRYLESPGTKAYTKKEAKKMFAAFKNVKVSTMLTHADLLESEAGQRHRGLILNMAKKLYPRYLIKKCFSRHGLILLIEGSK